MGGFEVNSPKTLYISDLDGTLMGADSRISEYSRSLLNNVISRGALVSIATARTPATVSKILEGLNLTLPAIVMTGAAMWNPATEEYSNIQYIDLSTAKKIVEIHERTSVPYFAYTLRSGLIHIYHPGLMSEIETRFAEERVGNRFKVLHCDGNPLPAEGLDDAILFYTMYNGDATVDAYKMLMEETRTNTLCYHDIFGPEVWILESFAETATKARAIAALASQCGAERIVVFGDNVNDISMMECADTAVAVGNAIESVKEKADVVIENNTADAVARWIYKDFTGMGAPLPSIIL